MVQQTFAQQTIKGTVTDQGGIPLAGVNIVEQGTTNGQITDFDGNYSITVLNTEAVLIFTYIGYTQQIITVGINTAINVILEENLEQLGEVVITALGFAESSDELGYATSVVTNESISAAKETSVINSLSGQTSGVRISRNSSDPGSGAYIQVRGISSIDRNSQPLIVVDGVPVSNDVRGDSNDFAQQSRLNDINPNDIESLTVLKGASAAALWGTQALGGVIQITTKSGKFNQKMKVNFNTTYSSDVINVKYPLQDKFGQGTNGVYTPNNTFSWGDKISERSGAPDEFNTTGEYYIDQDGTFYYPIISKNSRNVYDESNFDKIFRTGYFTENNLSISAGNQFSSIYFSLGDFNQEGIIKNADYRRTTASVNVKHKLNEKSELNASFKYSKTNSNRIRRGVSNNGLYLGLTRTPADFDISGYKGDYYASSSSAPISGRQRTYRRYLGESSSAVANNPLWTINEQENRSTVDRIIASVNYNLRPVEWLELIARAGVDKFIERGHEFYTPGAAATFVNGTQIKELATNSIFNMDYIAKASKKFNDNFNGDFLVGFNFNHKERVVEGNEINNFILFTDVEEEILDVDNALPENRLVTSSFGSERTVAGYTAANFTAYDQVFINATLRSEWASTFGLNSDKPFYFPSASIAWQFSELDMLSKRLLSFGKLRFSYAEVGVQPPRYNTFPEFVSPTYSDQLGGGLAVGLYGNGGFVPSSSLGNPALKPERKKEFEFGTDLRFFNNKLNINATYYTNEISDILLNFPIAFSRGYSELFSNAASMENKGVEIELGYTFFKNDDWNINLGLVYSKNKNEVTSLKEGIESIRLDTGLNGVHNRAMLGQQHGILWGTRSLRDEDGQIQFDANGFPITDPVQGMIGDPNPDWQGSAIGAVSYKNFSLSFLLETSQGGDIFAGTKSTLVDFGRWISTGNEVSASQNLLKFNGDVITAGTTFRGEIKNFGAGPVALTQEWYNGPGGFFGGNSELFVEDASWTRLRELTFSYKLSKDVTKLIGIDDLTLSLTGRNLFLWTKFEGNDPDTNVSGVSSSRGIDYYNNPSTKSYVFSLSLTF
ncbi:MAG: SusC/RagA family TonB-linked outer membrane protein [Flavobacteriales bacterium]|nr:SusC/RagA family TonB-linked outer membrane protein [Flavobacteriia bacterium]NCP05388.1 SusC/RagA family TonB-linked outer membrane protein [Flavobacteriales bacterium]PIV92579.1 MAG: SusC/RagA family TonB-linked outer membrane protein [Flavobacteriaceae bacterium CG17_big_fil_post_rev_8_21_14_2_50_33_15]PJB17135.1 MAG: SusC/RagA family TonB-linked outer membrane protein [Flavobacteriaceae bacterium CG_4_9_14_3_um_filter_33_16]NCQ15698.1 SusC/RagA family TonB-linked outer membrane protein [